MTGPERIAHEDVLAVSAELSALSIEQYRHAMFVAQLLRIPMDIDTWSAEDLTIMRVLVGQFFAAEIEAAR